MAKISTYSKGRKDLDAYITGGLILKNFIRFASPVVYQGENVVDFAEYKRNHNQLINNNKVM